MQIELLNTLHEKLISHFEDIGISDVNENNIRKAVLDFHTEISEDYIQALIDRMLGFGPLTKWLNDSDVSEVMVNGMESMYVEKNGKLISVPNEFSSADEILSVINKIVGRVGRRIDTSSPLVDARLPDGSRVNAIISPLSTIGPVVTIRKFPHNPPNLDKLVEKGTLTKEMCEFLKKSVINRANIVISGGTGSGKTTTLNALGSEIPESERVVTIEDSAEMKILHPHLISLESRPENLEGKGEVTVRALLKNALRMRPDRIIVGEIRSGEALDMLQAMNTGHPGSLTTVHANNPLEALHRIETMSLMADVELPLYAIREQLRGAVNLLVHQERLSNGERKITNISQLEVSDSQQDEGYKLNPLFTQ